MDDELRALLRDMRDAEDFFQKCAADVADALATGALGDAALWRAEAAQALRLALIAHPEWLLED